MPFLLPSVETEIEDWAGLLFFRSREHLKPRFLPFQGLQLSSWILCVEWLAGDGMVLGPASKLRSLTWGPFWGVYFCWLATSDVSSSCLTGFQTSLQPYLKPSPTISRFKMFVCICAKTTWCAEFESNPLKYQVAVRKYWNRPGWYWSCFFWLLYYPDLCWFMRLEFLVRYKSLKNKLELLFLIEWRWNGNTLNSCLKEVYPAITCWFHMTGLHLCCWIV